MLANYDKVMEVMLPTLGEERQQTYSPFLPVSPRSGKVLLAKVVDRDVAKGTITYIEEDGSDRDRSGHRRPLQAAMEARLGMRWAALGVDYEMSGKDHLRPGAALRRRSAGSPAAMPPEQFNYELFLDDKGQKISKSKGNGLTIDEWLTYGPPESLALFMFQKPRAAKRLYFDVIPKAVDEYIALLEAYHSNETSEAQRLENPVWHIHGGKPPDERYPVSFALLLNLVSALQRAQPRGAVGLHPRLCAAGASPQANPGLDRLVGYALRYYEDFVKPHEALPRADEKERAALADLADALEKLGDERDGADGAERRL